LGTQYDQEDLSFANEAFLDRIEPAFARTELPDPSDPVTVDQEVQIATSELYSTLREDLKSQYDQARTLMKLNQQLRQRLIYQAKSARLLLLQTMKQKEKLVQRLEIQAKDFQSDVIPQRVFDFIAHDKNLQSRTASQQARSKRKQLAK
jgi:hypothetical protein